LDSSHFSHFQNSKTRQALSKLDSAASENGLLLQDGLTFVRKAASFPVQLLGARRCEKPSAEAAAFFTLTNTPAPKQLRLRYGKRRHARQNDNAHSQKMNLAAKSAAFSQGIWEKRLGWEERQPSHPRYFVFARLCARLGRTDEAFDWLEGAYTLSEYV
jgi:hypothetical protein